MKAEATIEDATERDWEKKTAAQNQRLLWGFFGFLMLYPMSRIYATWQHDNVLEAVIRAQPRSSYLPVLFLTINNTDPSNAFLNRFNGTTPIVQKASVAMDKPPLDLRRLSLPSTVLIEPKSGQRGSRFNIKSDDITWYGPFYAKVGVDGMGAGQAYKVVRMPLRWVVVGSEMTWIS